MRLFVEKHLACFERTLLLATFVSLLISSESGFSKQQPASILGENVESNFLSDIRQLTFDGKRAGEGYFSADGKRLVFQSERDASNPFYQIYYLDLETGDTHRVSPGFGKTTCSWIHPDNQRVLFASTQNDPNAKKKQREEIEMRESGKERRYAWDYDDTYELYSFDTETKKYARLTEAQGYDAEASYSPDGKLIAFASNRRAFIDELNDQERSAFEIDPAVMADIFIMNADGTNLRQLTTDLGYDGGPFFSTDGRKICFRHFDVNGAVAEIFTMDLDGSNKKQLTRLGAMSWAPFFHPTGEYLIFATNKHGFSNFELYLVDAAGKSPPVRVSSTDGFDGLASFTPDGKTLTWTSNRTSNQTSQIFLAKWDHAAACNALGIDSSATSGSIDKEAVQTAEANAALTEPDFSGLDLMKHVDFLCRPSLAGRMTGSSGESKATAYVAVHFDILGLQPVGDNGSWLQQFDFPAGARLGPKNRLAVGETTYELNKDWRPLAFSRVGTIDASSVVFAGYGISAPKDDNNEEYDSYVHLDVKDKLVLMFRYLPENAADKQRQQLQFHSSLRKKAMDARDKGATGIIVVNGPTSMAREPLIPLENDFSMSGSSMAAISVSDEVAAAWLKTAGHDLKTLQEELDKGSPVAGFEISGTKVSAEIEIEQMVGKGHNVLGRLQAGDKPSETAIIVGAHIDHLGNGRSGSSLAREDESTSIHFGADDNASGVAAMLEIAEYLAKQKKAGKLTLERDIIFAGWSGEELGLIGSQHFVQSIQSQQSSASSTPGSHPTSAPTDSAGRPIKSIYPTIGACLNMDMVGRYNGSLILQGIGSSGYWTKAAEKNATIGLNLKLSNDTNLPTDASSFYRAGVPILAAFTGSHTDYHTPRDTPEKLNYEDAARIAKLMGLIARSLATEKELPEYLESKGVEAVAPRANMRAYLGSIPEYGADVKGVLLGGVTKDSPIEKAGVQAGDVIVELAGRKVESVQEYMFAIEALKIGQETNVVVLRGDQRIELKVTPGRR